MTTPEVVGTVADAPPKCARCESPAIWSFLWDWGEHGFVCAAHGASLQQLQDSLGRRVSLAPLQQAAPVPIGRDERVRLTARALVLEEELEEAKQRGLSLYRENVALAAQVQRLTMLSREASAQISDAIARIESQREELSARETELADVVAEVGRLRVVAAFVGDTPVSGGSLTGVMPSG